MNYIHPVTCLSNYYELSPGIYKNFIHEGNTNNRIKQLSYKSRIVIENFDLNEIKELHIPEKAMLILYNPYDTIKVDYTDTKIKVDHTDTKVDKLCLVIDI
jgi:hypothetical protein